MIFQRWGYCPVEIAVRRSLRLGQEVEGAKPSRRLTVLDAQILSDAAGGLHFPVRQGNLARDDHQIAGDHIRQIVGNRCHRFGQFDTEFPQARLDYIAHD